MTTDPLTFLCSFRIHPDRKREKLNFKRMCNAQYIFRKARSVETALHKVVRQTEQTLRHKEFTMADFLGVRAVVELRGATARLTEWIEDVGGAHSPMLWILSQLRTDASKKNKKYDLCCGRCNPDTWWISTDYQPNHGISIMKYVMNWALKTLQVIANMTSGSSFPMGFTWSVLQTEVKAIKTLSDLSDPKTVTGKSIALTLNLQYRQLEWLKWDQIWYLIEIWLPWLARDQRLDYLAWNHCFPLSTSMWELDQFFTGNTRKPDGLVGHASKQKSLSTVRTEN